MRAPGDKLLADANAWRRYRCRDGACGWGGLLEVHRHHHQNRNHLDPVVGVPRVVRIGVAALAMLLVAGLSWGLFHALAELIDN